MGNAGNSAEKLRRLLTKQLMTKFHDKGYIAALVGLALLLFYAIAHSTDYGQWKGYRLTPEQRDWFRHVTVPFDPYHGICCDIADGFPVPDAEKEADGHYWFTFDGQRWQVPEIAVIMDNGNPIGVPIAWITMVYDDPKATSADHTMVGGMMVKCFLPASES